MQLWDIFWRAASYHDWVCCFRTSLYEPLDCFIWGMRCLKQTFFLFWAITLINCEGNIPKQIASQTIGKCLNKYEMFWNPQRSPCAIVGFSRRLLRDNTVACAQENRMSLNTGVCPFAYPELAKCVDVLRFQKGIVITVHQTFPMNHCCIVHQNSHIPNLLKTQKHSSLLLSPEIFVLLCVYIPYPVHIYHSRHFLSIPCLMTSLSFWSQFSFQTFLKVSCVPHFPFNNSVYKFQRTQWTLPSVLSHFKWETFLFSKSAFRCFALVSEFL